MGFIPLLIQNIRLKNYGREQNSKLDLLDCILSQATNQHLSITKYMDIRKGRNGL